MHLALQRSDKTFVVIPRTNETGLGHLTTSPKANVAPQAVQLRYLQSSVHIFRTRLANAVQSLNVQSDCLSQEQSSPPPASPSPPPLPPTASPRGSVKFIRSLPSKEYRFE